MLEKILKDVLAGHEISKSDAILLVDADIVWLKQAANLIREYFCSNKFDLCSIINGKSGRCSENCKYCAQSIHYHTNVEVYDLLNEATIKDMALHNENKDGK